MNDDSNDPFLPGLSSETASFLVEDSEDLINSIQYQTILEETAGQSQTQSQDKSQDETRYEM